VFYVPANFINELSTSNRASVNSMWANSRTNYLFSRQSGCDLWYTATNSNGV